MQPQVYQTVICTCTKHLYLIAQVSNGSVIKTVRRVTGKTDQFQNNPVCCAPAK